MDTKITGKLINEKRKALGLTQKELADRLNVSNRTVSKWETGDGYPDISILPALAEVLEITIDELLTGKAPLPVAAKAEKAADAKRLRSKFLVSEIIAFSLAFTANAIGIITELKLFDVPVFYVFIEIYLLVLSVLLFATAVIIFFTAYVKFRFETEQVTGGILAEVYLFSAFSLLMPVAAVCRFVYYYLGAIAWVLPTFFLGALIGGAALLYKRIRYEKEDGKME